MPGQWPLISNVRETDPRFKEGKPRSAGAAQRGSVSRLESYNSISPQAGMGDVRTPRRAETPRPGPCYPPRLSTHAVPPAAAHIPSPPPGPGWIQDPLAQLPASPLKNPFHFPECLLTRPSHILPFPPCPLLVAWACLPPNPVTFSRHWLPLGCESPGG